MKKLVFAVIAAAALVGFGPRPAFAVDAITVANDKYAVDTTVDVDVHEYAQVTAAATYSAAAPAATNFDDGRKSTATITIASASGIVGKTVWVGGVRFAEGTDWTAVATASGTAKALSDAILANAALSAVCVSTWAPNGVVYTTATTPSGTPYTLSTSSPAAANLNGSTTARVASSLNGAEPKITLTTDNVITDQNHGLATGSAVYVTTTTGTMPTGLTYGTTYYVIKVNNAQVKLATSKVNASAGTAIDITALTGSGTMKLNPVAFAAVTGTSDNTGFKWQASNDGTTFYDLSVASVTYSAAGTLTWDFGANAWRTLRLKVKAPTFGALAVQVDAAGRR